MKLSDYTLSLLADIERRINPDTEDDYRAQWQSFWDGRVTGSWGSPTWLATPKCPV